MNLTFLEDPLRLFELQRTEALVNLGNLKEVRKEFLTYFPKDELKYLKLEDYVIGLPNRKNTFCNWLEYKLKGWGRYTGSALKSSVYYSKKNSAYKFVNSLGDDENEAFQKVRTALISLLDSGQSEDIPSIVINPLPPTLKGRVLGLYYPDRFLNIYTKHHLDFFLVQLRLEENPIRSLSEVEKREVLRDFKQNHPIMRYWQLHEFCLFLYGQLGKPDDWEKNVNSTEVNPKAIFPRKEEVKPEFIDLDWDSLFSTKRTQHKNSTHGKPNYEDNLKRCREIGDKGEKYVLELERAALEPNMAEKIDHVSLRDDSLGFDILSFELDTGKPKQIEVKSTTARAGHIFFYLTANEYSHALKLENYYLYIVFEVSSHKPKIWRLQNPFKKDPLPLKMTPAVYCVTLE